MIKKEIGEVYESKKVVNEAFYKLKYEYEVEQIKVRHVEYIVRRQEKLKSDMEYKKKKEEERVAEREAIQNPYMDEIENCTFLARYLSKILKDSQKKELADLHEEVKKETESEIK